MSRWSDGHVTSSLSLHCEITGKPMMIANTYCERVTARPAWRCLPTLCRRISAACCGSGDVTLTPVHGVFTIRSSNSTVSTEFGKEVCQSRDTLRV
eukprot:2613329-Amphidinium_carterae.1